MDTERLADLGLPHMKMLEEDIKTLDQILCQSHSPEKIISLLASFAVGLQNQPGQ